MRNTLFIIVGWAATTIVLCIGGLYATSMLIRVEQPPGVDPNVRLYHMLAEDLQAAFERDGTDGLASLLERYRERLPGERFVVDGELRDLVDQSDRSALVPKVRTSEFLYEVLPDGRFTKAVRWRNSPNYFVWVMTPWFSPPDPWPFVAVVVGIIAVMSTGLAMYLSVPLRRLKATMQRFASGDLDSRVQSKRIDEIGVVSREFDQLAQRVQTLLTAQRRLLQDVSHELRSPLTRLEVATDLAASPGEQERMLENIRRDVQRLSRLVSELLDLSCLEADPDTRAVEAVVLHDLVQVVVDDCTIEAEAKQCRLIVESTWKGSVTADSELLRRALENVLRNAVRHTPDGSEVRVQIEGAGELARVRVTDAGPGVPDELLASIFEPFFRVEGHRSRGTGGTGLGLAIARRAIEVCRGTIHAMNATPGLTIEVQLLQAATER
jgi:two-component system sensor histidine kinase CpxA